MRVPFQLPTAHSAVSIHGSFGAIAVKEGVGGVSSLSPEPLVELPPSPSAKGHVATSVTIAEFLFPGKSQTLDAMEEAVVGVGGSALSGVSAIGLASVTYDDFSEGEVGVILRNFSNCISSPIKSRFGAITSLYVFTNVYAWCRLIRLDCITYAIVTVDDRDIPAVQCTMHFAFSVAFAKLINSKAGAKNEGKSWFHVSLTGIRWYLKEASSKHGQSCVAFRMWVMPSDCSSFVFAASRLEPM